MPPNRAVPQQTFNTNLLEPDALATQGGFQTALDSVERICYHSDSSITEMIVGLNSRPHILEYIFSSMSRIPAIPMV